MSTTRLTVTLKPGNHDALIQYLREHPGVKSVVSSDPVADGWIPWKPGDPIPKGEVYIREKEDDGTIWESGFPEDDWAWPSNITHYKPAR